MTSFTTYVSLFIELEAYINIHTPGGSHHRPYHFNWKEKWTNKGTDKQYVAEFLYTVQLVLSDVCTEFQNFR